MSTTPVYTEAALRSLLGDKYEIKASRNGAFQVNIANLGSYDNDYDKGKAQFEAYDKLTEAGYPMQKSDFRSSSKNRSGNWVTWPCVWVNPPGATTQQGVNIDTMLINLFEEADSLGIDITTFAGGTHQQVFAVRKAIASAKIEAAAKKTHETTTADSPDDAAGEDVFA